MSLRKLGMPTRTANAMEMQRRSNARFAMLFGPVQCSIYDAAEELHT